MSAPLIRELPQMNKTGQKRQRGQLIADHVPSYKFFSDADGRRCDTEMMSGDPVPLF